MKPLATLKKVPEKGKQGETQQSWSTFAGMSSRKVACTCYRHQQTSLLSPEKTFMQLWNAPGKKWTSKSPHWTKLLSLSLSDERKFTGQKWDDFTVYLVSPTNKLNTTFSSDPLHGCSLRSKHIQLIFSFLDSWRSAQHSCLRWDPRCVLSIKCVFQWSPLPEGEGQGERGPGALQKEPWQLGGPNTDPNLDPQVLIEL